MRNFLLALFLMVACFDVGAQGARQRVSSATVYADWANGNDANDGTQASQGSGTVGPVKTIQRAFDVACGNYDIAPPWTWTGVGGNEGYKSGGVTVQLAPATSSVPYNLPAPAFLDGVGCSGHVTLRGDPSGSNALNYNLYCDNTLQGLTAQNGAKLIVDGITIRGHQYCTFINALQRGSITIRKVYAGQGANGPGNVAGAAGMSTLTTDGNLILIGSGFNTIYSAIETAQLIFSPNAAITINNTMNFGIMLNMMQASAWTQGYPIAFNGAGLSTSTGSKYNAYYGASIMFCTQVVPGSAGASDSTSWVPFTGC